MLRIFIQWLSRTKRSPNRPLTVEEQARRLIAAIDAGGIPLNPAKVNHIARGLGLEVSRQARVEDTIQRIRTAMARAKDAY